MSDQIAPIQRDAIGNTTFEKVQTIEIKEPDTSAKAPATGKSAAACSPEDGLNFSRPMKKFLLKKKSYFTAPPATPEVQKQHRRDQETPGSRFQHEG